MNSQDRLLVLHEQMRACRRCLDAGHEVTIKAIFSGGSSSRVLVIGQAPGITELAAGRPFNASSGRRLFMWLESAGWEEDDFRANHYITAVTKCYPGKDPSGRGDRVPSKAEQLLCRPFLDQEIELINPSLIIPVGGLAIKLFYPSESRLSEVIGRGYYYPSNVVRTGSPYSFVRAIKKDSFDRTMPRAGRWLVPLPHPSGASHWPNVKSNQALIDRAIAFLSDVRTAWAL